jgi:hypothetical protein
VFKKSIPLLLLILKFLTMLKKALGILNWVITIATAVVAAITALGGAS